ncbi:MAG TPA: hypothetical protein VIJ29_00905 [Candidatus Paceibacterota bacterium]
MVGLIFLGTDSLFSAQIAMVNKLLTLYGLPVLGEEPLESEVWMATSSVFVESDTFSCRHYEVDIPSLLSSASGPQQLFLVEAAKVPGLYINECPEHGKRRFWEKNERELLASARTGG